MLHDIEYVATIASLKTKYAYPKAEIDSLWKTLLLCQFHDVLPGTCIEIVQKDVREIYKKFFSDGKELLESALKSLGIKLGGKFYLSTLPWKREQVVPGGVYSGLGAASILPAVTAQLSFKDDEILRLSINHFWLVSNFKLNLKYKSVYFVVCDFF